MFIPSYHFDLRTKYCFKLHAMKVPNKIGRELDNGKTVKQTKRKKCNKKVKREQLETGWIPGNRHRYPELLCW
jgi:hypothetical protein